MRAGEHETLHSSCFCSFHQVLPYWVSSASLTLMNQRQADGQTDHDMFFPHELPFSGWILFCCIVLRCLDADTVAPSSVSGVQSLGSSAGESVDKHIIYQNWQRFKNLSHTVFSCWECDLFLILLCFCFRVWGMGPGSLWESFFWGLLEMPLFRPYKERVWILFKRDKWNREAEKFTRIPSRESIG